MNKDKVKLTAITVSLMLCSYTGVQGILNQKDIRASEIVKEKILNNEPSIIINSKTKHVATSKEKRYRPCKRLVILCNDFMADTIRVEGTGKYKNETVKFTLYGRVEDTQKLTVDAKQISEGVYLEKVGDTIKLNLGNSGLEITKAKCILTGKSTYIK